MAARSLLFIPGQVLDEPPECKPARQEVTIRVRKNGRLYTMVMRDKTVVEDPYLVQVKAAAFAIQQNEPYMGRAVPRSVRDVYIKTAVTI